MGLSMTNCQHTDANHVNKAFHSYQLGAYDQAFRRCTSIPNSIELMDDETNVQFAILKYYEYRLRNRSTKAGRFIRAAEHLLQNNDINEDLHKELNGLLSTVSIEQNKDDEIQKYKSFWANNSNLSPLQEIQKLRVALNNAHVTNSNSNQKHYLEQILNVLLENKLEFHPEMALTLRDLGINSKINSDFERSLTYFTDEKNVYLHYYDSSHIGFGIAEYHIASLYYETLEFQKSLDHYLSTLKNFKQNSLPDRNMRYVYEGIGDMHFELGQSSEAAIYWHEASNYHKKKSNDLLDARAPQADSLMNSSQFNDAIGVYEEALEFRQAQYGVGHYLTGRCHAYIARAYLKKGKHALALTKFHQAIQIYIPTLSDTSMLSVPSLASNQHVDNYLMEALVGKSSALFSMYLVNNNSEYLFAANGFINLALTALQNLRFGQRSKNSQFSISSMSRELIELGLAINHSIYGINKEEKTLQQAFELIELSRSFLLHQALQQAKAFSISNVPSSIIEKEKNLRNEMSSYAAKINMEEKQCSEANNDYVTTWKNHLRQLRISYDALVNEINRDYPKFYDLAFNKVSLSYQMLQSNSLSSKDMAISYFQGENHLYAFTMTTSSVDFIQIEYVDDMDALIDSFRLCLSQHTSFLADPIKSKKLLINIGHMLFNQLLAPLPIEKDLVDHIYIISDRSLHSIPFEVLLSKNNLTTEQYNELSYLLHDFDFSYATSFKLLNDAQHIPTEKPGGYIGFAPTYHSTILQPNRSRIYGNLSFNEAEVKAAAHHFNGEFLTDDQATKSTFLKASKKEKILHVAAHATMDDEYPLLSHIIFSPATPDSLLYAYEIYNLHLTADLAVLSACNTGIGQIRPGEGAMSLSRAFQYAGCPSQVMTLWSVDDRESSQVMNYFFENLSKGQTKHVALSSAKRSYLSSSDPALSHPFYWAGYVLLGNNQALDMSSSNWVFIAFGVLFGLIGLIYIIKSKLADKKSRSKSISLLF